MRLGFIVIMILNSYIIFSQERLLEKNIELDSVKINTTKNINSMSTVPFPVHIINDKEIFLTGNNLLNDVLKNQTGIITTSTKTGTQGVQMQGLDASYIPILIDGFPLIGRSFGVLDLKRINLNNVKKIEILKGAASSFYGSNALGGVINIITKEQNNYGSCFSGNLKYMTNNTLNPDFSYSYKNKKLSINNNFNYYSTAGYDLIKSDLLNTINPYYNYNINSRIKYSISNTSFMKSNFSFFNQKQENTADSFGQILEGESFIREFNSLISFKHYLNKKIIIEADCYLTNYKAEEFLNDTLDNLFDNNYFDQIYINRELKLIYKKNQNLNLFFGTGITNESLSRQDFDFTPNQKLHFIYSQINFNKNNVINLMLGSRYDNYLDYKYQISNNLAFGLTVNENFKVKTSFGTGFKIPDFRQRYFNFTQSTIGYTILGRDILQEEINLLEAQGLLLNIIMPLSELDDNLNPESSFSVNFSSDLKFNNVNISCGVFRNNIKNLIEPQIVAYKNNSLPVFSYFNINQVITQGLEFNLDWNCNTSLNIIAGYQLLYAFDPGIKNEFQEGNVYARDPQTLISFQLQDDDYIGLFNRSKHMFNFKMFYNYNKKMDIVYGCNYNSNYATSDSNDNGVYDKYDQDIDGYMLHNLNFTYKLSNTKILQLGCNNILDFTNPQNISNISGRIFYINFKTNFLI